MALTGVVMLCVSPEYRVPENEHQEPATRKRFRAGHLAVEGTTSNLGSIARRYSRQHAFLQ